jgi:predicted lipoprotein with Yx(FWY)xxD motif
MTKHTALLIIAAVMALSVGTTAAAGAPDPVAVGETSKGATLVDRDGMTLYTFDRDFDGKSVCNGPCAANWPPVVASADDSGYNSYSVIARDDVSRQWAYKGKPLYRWIKDQKPGDITGDGLLNGTWHVAQP